MMTVEKGSGGAGKTKKTYEKPVLKEFGKLQLLTQGTGGMASDTNGLMTMML